jgi:hypothetical protein
MNSLFGKSRDDEDLEAQAAYEAEEAERLAAEEAAAAAEAAAKVSQVVAWGFVCRSVYSLSPSLLGEITRPQNAFAKLHVFFLLFFGCHINSTIDSTPQTYHKVEQVQPGGCVGVVSNVEGLSPRQHRSWLLAHCWWVFGNFSC